jgi:hypothetical protein
METEVRQIDLAATANLAQDIANHNTILAATGFRLVTSFSYQTYVVLVFQR